MRQCIISKLIKKTLSLSSKDDTLGRRIGLVIGCPRSARVLTSLRPFFELAQAMAFIMHDEGEQAVLPNWAASKLYHHVEEYSGYMRGLESELKDVDLLIACEINQLSSLQTLQVAKRNKIPFYLYISQEVAYQYEGMHQLNALQHELLSKAHGFIVPSRSLYHMVERFPIAERPIYLLPPVVDEPRFRPSLAARQKFRSYLRMDHDDRVILFHDHLEKNTHPELLLKALRSLAGLKGAGPVAAKTKLIFAGNGAYATELKYLAYQLGVGHQSYFLHQDTEPFIADLYAASDVIIFPKAEATLELPLYPHRLLAAMACGVVPIVGADSVHEEILCLPELTIKHGSYEDLALILWRLLRTPERMQQLQAKVLDVVSSRHCLKVARDAVACFLGEVTRQRMESKKEVLDEIQSIEGDRLERGADETLLGRISALLTKPLPSKQRGLMLCLQGEVAAELGRLDDAIASFESAIAVDATSARPQRGLGYLSWQSHSHVEAITFFRKALALQPNDAQAMLGIGLVHKRVGMIDEALVWLERSITACPDNDNRARYALIQACASSPDHRKGILVLQRVVDLVGEDNELMCALGQLHVRSGNEVKGHQILVRYLI